VASELVLGVDLGTTYSTAAVVIDGKIHYAVDGRGEASIPSVVHFPKSGPPVIGTEAVRVRATDPQNTVAGIKRVIGRPADAPAVRLLDQVAAFRIKAQGKAEVSVVVRTGEYTASEVASLILRFLRERAELRFGNRISKAVLTVPVMANAAVREAMVRCGKMAGLEVTRIVSEPCAGGVARGMAAAGVGSATSVAARSTPPWCSAMGCGCASWRPAGTTAWAATISTPPSRAGWRAGSIGSRAWT
jgi:molecular chaperone DnaK